MIRIRGKIKCLMSWGTLSPKPPGIYRFEVQSCTGRKKLWNIHSASIKEHAESLTRLRCAATDEQSALGLLPSRALPSD